MGRVDGTAAASSSPGVGRRTRFAGRSHRRAESEPVSPVDDATVQDTLPYLPPILADMVRFQQFTGCRPAEVCLIRPMDVDTSNPTWVYTPAKHKTAWSGHKRVIFIGPRGQEILRPLLAAAHRFLLLQPEGRRPQTPRRVARDPHNSSLAGQSTWY